MTLRQQAASTSQPSSVPVCAPRYNMQIRRHVFGLTARYRTLTIAATITRGLHWRHYIWINLFAGLLFIWIPIRDIYLLVPPLPFVLISRDFIDHGNNKTLIVCRKTLWLAMVCRLLYLWTNICILYVSLVNWCYCFDSRCDYPHNSR
jgi:hypothetical protein